MSADTPASAGPLVDQVADRAEDAGPDDVRDQVEPHRAAPAPARLSPHSQHALADALHHLGAASATARAGTDIPSEARMRQVKKAVITAMRPVTSHQVPFNEEVLLTIGQIATVLEEVAGRLGAVDAIEERNDAALRRVRAGIATVEVQADDLDAAQADLRASLAATRDALDDLRAEVGDLVRAVRAGRAREEVVLRAAGGSAEATAPAAAARDEAEAALVRRLAAVGRPEPEVVVGWAAAVRDTVAQATAPILDLDPDRGEWLDAWAGLDVPAVGVDPDADRVARLRERGHEVHEADAATHLAGLPAGSLGAVTAAVLADVRPLADLVAVVDAALVALRPGGLLVLAAAHPAGAPAGDVLWSDPRRRPVAPEVLWALAVDRGYAEVEVVPVEASVVDPGLPRVYALVARTTGGGPRPS